MAALPGAARGGSWPQIPEAIPAIGASLLGDQFSDPVKESLPTGFLEKNAALFSVLARMPGTIRKISIPPRFTSSGPLVVYIQDVHRNEEAQRNIGATVAGLLAEGNAGLLALEGAFGTIPLQPFRDFQNRQAVRQAADYLLKENRISGPIHAVLSGPGPSCPVIGIDDPLHYAANVEAYRHAVPSQNDIQNSLRARARILEQEKKNVFSPPLLEFDRRVAAYRARQLSLGDYVQVLEERERAEDAKGGPFSPDLRHYSKAVAMERAMDFAQVERERTALIEQLARKISPAQEKDLLAVTLAYRARQVRPADFYGRLNRLCVKNGISLAAFPAMDEYLHYVLLADKIRPELLYQDILSLERKTYQKLARTSDEQRVVGTSRTLYLTEKLVEFSLTPTEWAEYEAGLLGGAAEGENLKPFETFYREATVRDQAMGDHFLRAMRETAGPTAVLVTGGFHAEGLTETLTKGGAAVVSFVPKIEKLDVAEGAAYLSVFTQEKTPLEKLYQGEKLFLADHPVSPRVLHTLLPLLVAIGALYLGGLSLNLDPQVLYSSLGGMGVLGAVKIVGDQIRLRLSGRNGEASLLIKMASAGIADVTEGPNSKLGIWGKKVRVVRDRWVLTKSILKEKFTLDDRVNPTQIRKELIYVLPILGVLLYNAGISPVAPWVYFVTGGVSLGWFLWDHKQMFRSLQQSTPDRYKKYVPFVYFPFVALGFVLFTGFGVGVFSIVVALTQTGAGTASAAGLAAAAAAFLIAVLTSHPYSNSRLAVPAVAKRRKPMPPEAISKGPPDEQALRNTYNLLIKAVKMAVKLSNSKAVREGKPSLEEEMQAKGLSDSYNEFRDNVMERDERARRILELDGPLTLDDSDDDWVKEQDKLNRIFDAVWRYVFIPAGRAPFDLNSAEGFLMIQKDSWVPVTYFGETIWVAQVKPEKGISSKFMSPAMGGVNGFIFYDPGPVEYHQNEIFSKSPDAVRIFFQMKKKGGITGAALNYGITDLIVRYQLAYSKMAIVTALKNNVSVSGVSRELIQDTIVRPGGPLQLWWTNRINDKKSAGELVPEIEATAIIVDYGATLDGLIENLRYLAFHFGEKRGPEIAHLVGVFGLMEICFKATASETALHHQFISAGVLRGHIVNRIHFTPNAVVTALNRSVNPNELIFRALSAGDLNNYEKLLALLETIRDENLYTPVERFIFLNNRGPRSSELWEVTTPYPIIATVASPGNAPTPIMPPVKKKSPTMEEMKKKFSTGYGAEEVSVSEVTEKFLEISQRFSRVAEGEELEKFKELRRELEGGGEAGPGFRVLVGEMKHRKKDGIDSLASVEDVLMDLAKKAFQQGLGLAQKSIGTGNFDEAIRLYLKLEKDHELMEVLGGPMRVELDGHLQTARALFVQRQPNSGRDLGWVVANRELFGFDDQEVEFLKTIKENRSALPLDLLGLKSLEKRLGKYSPKALTGIIEKSSQVTDQKLKDDGDENSIDGFRVFINPGIDPNYLRNEWTDIITKLRSYIEKGLTHQAANRLPEFEPGYSDDYVGQPLKNILYDRTTSGRFFFMVFDEPMDGGERRKTIAIVGVANASSIKIKATGKLSPEVLTPLIPVGLANSFGNREVFGKYVPVELGKWKKKTRDNPASLADRLAINQWGADSRKYYRYTKYVAPAWEWIYFVPGLNLLGQWGLSDWIIKRFFPAVTGKVVRRVPLQEVWTVVGLVSLGVWFWVGGWGLAFGALFSVFVFAFLFGEAHPEDAMPEKEIGFWSILTFWAPTLILFWWDPLWLTGMGAVYGYLGSFVLGWGGSYFLHSFRQQVKKYNPDAWAKNIIAPARSSPLNEVVVIHDVGSFVLKWAMETERFLALGDTDRARTSFESLTIYSKDMNAPLLQSYVAGLEKRMREMEEHPMTDESRAVSLLLELMEDSLAIWDLKALFDARDFVHEKIESATAEQKELVRLWEEIVFVLAGLLESTNEADRRVINLGETGRNLFIQEGIFRPYQEKILFQLLRSYWAWREKGGDIKFPLLDYEPTLARILKKHPSLDMDIGELSDIVGKYVEGHKRSGILKYLLEKGMTDKQAFMFLFEIDVNAQLDHPLIRKAEGPPKNGGGVDPLETSGMHAVGGQKSEEDRLIFQRIEGSEATVEIRRQWSDEIRRRLERHRERRRAIQNLGLGDSFDQFLTLLVMENPAVKMGDRVIPVHFQLLPGSWKQVSPGSPRADWYFRVSTNQEIESVEIILHQDDLAAVVHEGVEAVLSLLPDEKRPDGKPHTYAFLAEMVANDNGDDLVPQRALEEVDHKSLEELANFLKGSANSRDEIEHLFSDSSRFVVKKRLLEIQEKLELRARDMVNERKMDPLWLFHFQAAKAEKSIALGYRVQGQQDLKDLDRSLYHLERTKVPHPLQSSFVAELHKRLNIIIEISEKAFGRDRVFSQDFAVHLQKMEGEFVYRNFKGLLNSFKQMEVWRPVPLSSEQKELVAFWKDIEDILRPLIRDHDWTASDQKVHHFENRWRGELGRLGVGHLYIEGLFYDFLQAYQAQRIRGNDWSYYLAPENDDNKPRTPFLLNFMKIYPNVNTSLKELSMISLAIKLIIKSTPGSGQNLESASSIRNQKGIVLTDMALFLPGIVAAVSVIGWVLVKGVTDPGFVLPSLFAMTAVGLIVVGVIGVVVIHVSVRFKDFLDRKKLAAHEFASALKTAQEEGDSAQRLSLDVAGKDLVRKVSAEDGVWFRRYLKEAMAKRGVAPLSFAAARALIALKGWGAQVFEVSAGLMPDAGGARPLVVVYLNKDMVSGGVADLAQRYSPGGEGGVAFVPTDAGARAAVLSLPDTFGGLIFDGGTNRVDRVPSLAEVERRLENAGVEFSQYTGCRVVTPVGMALDMEGVRSHLFKEALVILLNGLTGIALKREHLRFIDRAAQAVFSAA